MLQADSIIWLGVQIGGNPSFFRYQLAEFVYTSSVWRSRYRAIEHVHEFCHSERMKWGEENWTTYANFCLTIVAWTLGKKRMDLTVGNRLPEKIWTRDLPAFSSDRFCFLFWRKNRFYVTLCLVLIWLNSWGFCIILALRSHQELVVQSSTLLRRSFVFCIIAVFFYKRKHRPIDSSASYAFSRRHCRISESSFKLRDYTESHLVNSMSNQCSCVA